MGPRDEAVVHNFGIIDNIKPGHKVNWIEMQKFGKF